MKIKKVLSAILSAVIATTVTFGMVACGDDPVWNPPANTEEYDIPQDYTRTYYEVFVRSFADSNGDGIGDLRGLADNLDYLNDGDDSTMTDLGINGIWMMPINQSPSYHKYDVEDYYDIDDEYGTLEDFDYLVQECEKRDIWLQMDLVLNHTSKEHPWFKEAVKELKNGGASNGEYASRYCIYPFNDPPAVKQSSRFQRINGTNYGYVCNFDGGMPDLNLSSMTVRDEITKIVEFWLKRGIKSFRLDAVPWACAYDVEFNDDNDEFWSWFNEMCDEKGKEVYGEKYPGLGAYCYNVGEAWTGKQTIESFYGTGMSNFSYSLGGQTASDGFAGVVNDRKSGYWLASELEGIQKGVLDKDEHAILSNFLSNHDNNRSAGFFAYEASKIKRAAGLYLLAPGNPYIYYGEEIGAAGSGVDPNKRMPFNWGDSHAAISNPPGVNYEGDQPLGTWAAQTHSESSVLTYYRNAIRLRNRFPEIGRGLITAYALDKNSKPVLQSELIESTGNNMLYNVNGLNERVVIYTLTWKERSVLIVHNVSEKSAEINMSEYADYSLVGSLTADGGSVALSGGTLSMPSGTVAVIKK